MTNAVEMRTVTCPIKHGKPKLEADYAALGLLGLTGLSALVATGITVSVQSPLYQI